MSDLIGQKAELRFTLEIKRAETGMIETYNMVGDSDGLPIEKLEEKEDGSNT